MADNVLIATKNDDNGAHQQVVQEFLDGGGAPVQVSAANPLPVAAEVTIDPAGLATSAIQTDGTQKTQIVDSGGDAVTVTGGKLDVNASIDTTGLATEAGQDTGNASLATIAGAVSGTEMQVDVLTMPTTTVQATNLDIRDLAFASDKVDASGTVLGPGTNNIGDVDVLSLPALPAGNNNIGDVDIASIAAGSNIIGRVGIDQTTPGTTNGVQINAALPAGTNAIGKLSANDGVDIGDVTINNAAGAAAVNIQDGGNTITVDGTVAFSNTTIAVTNAGVFATQSVVAGDVANDGIDSGNPIKIGGRASAAPPSAVADGDRVQAWMTPTGTLNVTPTPSTGGGWSTFMATTAGGSTALTNSAQAIKGSAGTFGGYYIFNPNSVQIYVSIYNVVAASVTVGTTNPQNSFCIPPLAAANLEITNGINFSTAMSCAATTTGGGNTAPTTALEANFFYK